MRVTSLNHNFPKDAGSFDYVTGQWTRVDVGIFSVNKFPTNTFGRIVEHIDHILFEDERDVTIYKLGLQT